MCFWAINFIDRRLLLCLAFDIETYSPFWVITTKSNCFRGELQNQSHTRLPLYSPSTGRFWSRILLFHRSAEVNVCMDAVSLRSSPFGFRFKGYHAPVGVFRKDNLNEHFALTVGISSVNLRINKVVSF